MKDIYIIREGERRGPFTEEQLMAEALTPETLVWHEGLTDWQPAASLPEMARFLASANPEVEESAFGTYAEVPPEPQPTQGYPGPQTGHGNGYGAPQAGATTQYYAMVAGTRIGPMPVTDLLAYGVRPDTPVWCKEMMDWQPASSRPDIMMHLDTNPPRQSYGIKNDPSYGQRPENGQQPNYGYQNGFNQNPGNGYGTQHYNWMTWAIIGTIFGALFSCIGLIFGAIAISKASSANNAYAMGDDRMGDQYNATAKTMTIISLVLAGVGLLINIWAMIYGISLLSLASLA